MAAKSHYGADPPSNYLPLSIFTLLCCFWPLGLIALMHSFKVNSASNQDEARSASKVALWSNIIGIIIGVILVAAAIVVVVVYYTVIFPSQLS